jgi:hypothetical protein
MQGLGHCSVLTADQWLTPNMRVHPVAGRTQRSFKDQKFRNFLVANLILSGFPTKGKSRDRSIMRVPQRIASVQGRSTSYLDLDP